MSSVLSLEDKRILLASVNELQECINQTYSRFGACELFFEMCAILDERLGRLNADFES